MQSMCNTFGADHVQHVMYIYISVQIHISSLLKDCLAGLVVKASALGAEDPGFASRL